MFRSGIAQNAEFDSKVRAQAAAIHKNTPTIKSSVLFSASTAEKKFKPLSLLEYTESPRGDRCTTSVLR